MLLPVLSSGKEALPQITEHSLRGERHSPALRSTVAPMPLDKPTAVE